MSRNKKLLNAQKDYIQSLEPTFSKCFEIAKENVCKDLSLPNVSEDSESYNIAVSSMEYFLQILRTSFRLSLGLPAVDVGDINE